MGKDRDESPTSGRASAPHGGEGTALDDRVPVSARLDDPLARLELLHRVGVALSAEKDKDRLVEMILVEAQRLCNAEGGTLYLRDGEALVFDILRNDVLGTALGGSSGQPVNLPPLALRGADGAPNLRNVATAAANQQRTINIADAYNTDGFDFSGTKKFDERAGYRSRSFLTIPLLNNEHLVIGVLQLINARDPWTGAVIPFSDDLQRMVEALASQAGIALDNQLLLDGQKQLLESFIKMIASAIDSKSPYTGGHCERVPRLAELLARSLCDATDGPFADFTLSAEEWYELRIAAWLHDCGKVITPVHVMDKATKLETIFDRMHIVRERFEVLRRDAELEHLRAVAAGASPDEQAASAERLAARLRELDDDLGFLETANIGGEFMSDEKKARVRRIAERRYMRGAELVPLLSDEEVYNLCVSRGTLTDEERIIINAHMVHTIRMLESLPFPRHLARVPEYAGGHHEKMDGTGYPKGIYAGDMSVPARLMAIADVFEALTAQDRPYKTPKTLSESMRIMGFMKRDNHLDPEVFDHFVRSGVYRQYAERFLPAELIDEVDEAALFAIVPREFAVPPEDVRQQRWRTFLPEYQLRESIAPHFTDGSRLPPVGTPGA